MNKLLVGIVDYGIGNHKSVFHTLNHIGYRSRVTDDHKLLSACDILLLPGVGAFAPAMQALQDRGLDKFILDEVISNHTPILGICLGMQLLCTSSSENLFTSGLNLISCNVKPLYTGAWHIGWNSLSFRSSDPIFSSSQNSDFYFNHSYAVNPQHETVIGTTVFNNSSFGSVVRNGNVVGFQFHPEKSQLAGHRLLTSVINGLCDA